MASHARYLTGPLGKHTRPKVIEIRQLTVLQEQQPVLRDITLDIFEGESVALLGATDFGKSALLACIQGQLQPTTGELHVLGAALPPLPPEVRCQIGVLPAQLDRNTHETVAAYLQLLKIADDGVGLPTNLCQRDEENYTSYESPAGHYGLSGMLERVKTVQGQLAIAANGNHGTTVEVTLPLVEAPLLTV
jgi:ABC-type thiamine transport system ATPase subunit